MDAYYKDYLQGLPDGDPRRLGLHGRDRDAGDPHGAQSGVFDKYPNLKIILGHLGETLPFLVWRIDQALSRPGGKTDQLPRHVLQPLLSHHQRQLLQSGAAVLRAGDGRRPHHVRGRLAVRRQSARHAMDRDTSRCARRTRSRSSAATPSGCCGCRRRYCVRTDWLRKNWLSNVLVVVTG